MITTALLQSAVAVGRGAVDKGLIRKYREVKVFVLSRVDPGLNLEQILSLLESDPEEKLWHDGFHRKMAVAGLQQSFEVKVLGEELMTVLQQAGFVAAPPDRKEEKAGVIASGQRATAAGDGGTAIGTVMGSVYLGEPVADREEALDMYREYLVQQNTRLSMRGLDAGVRDVTSGGTGEPELAQVYVHLNVTAPPEKRDFRGSKESEFSEKALEERPCLKEVAGRNPVIILGDPGTGKSTFLKHFVLCLANFQRGIVAWRERIVNWPEDELHKIPVYVVLRDFANWLADNRREEHSQQEAGACTLWDFICSRLKSANLEFVTVHLRQKLERGELIVMLDGLDEISTEKLRLQVHAEIEKFIQRYRHNRLLMTCRIASYERNELRLKEVQSIRLAPFTREQMDMFLHAWFRELGGEKEKSDLMADRLLEAIDNRPDLGELAPNPLLLAIMAMVHDKRGELPESRAVLYEEAIDLLLHKWDGVKEDGKKDVLLREKMREVGLHSGDLMAALGTLAFEVLERGGSNSGRGLADIGENELLRHLKKLHPANNGDDTVWAVSMIDIIRQRAGLLVEREPGTYTFPHRTFQEYLAGVHLSTVKEFERDILRLAEKGPYWKQVILLATGKIVHNDVNLPRALFAIHEIVQSESGANMTVAGQVIRLAGEMILEAGVARVRGKQTGKKVYEKVRGELENHLRDMGVQVPERVEAGRLLAKLGDPRKEVIHPEETEFLPVEAGEFLMGDGEKQFGYSLGEYRISRYPVTQAQFRLFVDAGGYGDAMLWREAIDDGVWAEGKVEDPFSKDLATGPRRVRVPFNLDNHPVVGICWYEALAYCRWLTVRLQEHEQLPIGWEVRLPSEPEWEKAARGRHGQLYPWPGEFDANNCNSSEGEIQSSTCVGCFPGGKSPYGVEDMVGNVWEWTASVYGDYPHPVQGGDLKTRQELSAGRTVARVLRGGAYLGDKEACVCASRFGNFPSSWYYVVGFRVVCAPKTSEI